MINFKYNNIEIEIPLCRIKVIAPKIEIIITKEEYEKYENK